MLIRSKNEGSSLLHFFCNEGCSDNLLLLLIDAGIPVNDRNHHGCTPLHAACFHGRMSMCKLLVSRGASLRIESKIGETPLMASTHSCNAELAIWLIKQHEAGQLHWDNAFFSALMQKTPAAAWSYLDKFAIDIGPGKEGRTDVRLLDLRHIYGTPDQKVDVSALATAVKYVNSKNVLNHRVMQQIMYVKWMHLHHLFERELGAYILIVLSYYFTIIFADREWMKFKNRSDYAVVVSRAYCWEYILYLMYVEFKEMRGGGYFKSYWNWFSLITYGAIVASIPLEFAGESARVARDGLLAFITVALWINLLQYFCIYVKAGLMVATMEQMLRDVRQFFAVYLAFLFGFSGGLHLILTTDAGYETFGDTLITVLLMLFGNITYDPFHSATGWKWVFSNALLFGYLVCVVIILLNVLIAMMSTSFARISESAEDQHVIRLAELLLRIERSLSTSTREEQFDVLAPSFDERMIKRKVSSSGGPEEATSQTASSKVKPFEDSPTHELNGSEPAIASDCVAEPADNEIRFHLQDGIRSFIPIKKTPLSQEMELRFDSLDAELADVKQTNAQLVTQIRELATVIGELQQQLRVPASPGPPLETEPASIY